MLTHVPEGSFSAWTLVRVKYVCGSSHMQGEMCINIFTHLRAQPSTVHTVYNTFTTTYIYIQHWLDQNYAHGLKYVGSSHTWRLKNTTKNTNTIFV